jgi:Fe-S-cluster-containing hydrogenase component 2
MILNREGSTSPYSFCTKLHHEERSMKEKSKILVDATKCAQCLLCQLMCSFTHTKTFNISKSRIVIDIARRTIVFSEECNSCGTCAHYCAYGALTIEARSRGGTHEEI